MAPGQYSSRNGSSPYLSLTLWRDKKPFKRYVHRLVLEAFVGPCPEGMQCRHLNGNASDNRVENLAWGTPRQNCRDIERHGTRRAVSGESHKDAKLTRASVISLRAEFQAGASASTLAARYGVNVASARSAATGKTWRDVPMPEGKRKRLRRPGLDPLEKERARAWRDEGVTIREIASRLSIDPSCVSVLLSGKARRR